MEKAIRFKWLQRKFKFRNSDFIHQYPVDSEMSDLDKKDIRQYLEQLNVSGISYTYPTHADYPAVFYQMKEPPLFLEYIGTPVWKQNRLCSVVGSRKIHPLSQRWMASELTQFVERAKVTVVSGGANGVDQAAHLAALKAQQSTIVVLPSGLGQLYPQNLTELKEEVLFYNGCFLSEFEQHQKVQKNYFYLRNRLIAALGCFTLIVQATQKSGTLLTVHHALEFGRPVVVVPGHPMLVEFSGNMKLIKDGASLAHDFSDLLDFWHAESWSGLVMKSVYSTDGA